MKSLSAGQYVEAYVLEMLEELYGDAYRSSTKEEDYFYGTDCFIQGVPIDVTLRDHKTRSKFIKKYMLEGVTINVLRRFGNSYQMFDKPVLVFHFEVYGLADRMQICELIEENLTKDIVSEILGFYN